VSRTVIVVPCYNEARRLDPDALAEFVERHDDIDFKLVNDGSSDDTLDRLRLLESRHPSRFSVLDLDPNRGKAEAVRHGISASFDEGVGCIGFWDADLATPLAAIPQLRGILDAKPGIDMVFGSRVKLLGRSIERKMARHYLGRVFATVVSVMLRLGIYDTQCGAKLFRATPEIQALFADPFTTTWVFDVEIIARLIQARRLTHGADVAESIYEYPLEEWRDVAGSKLHASDFARAVLEILHIWRTYLR
jgi:glycosyltransferase involved in cell wall biosynthesis